MTKRRSAPLCIEAWCNNRARKRTNWHTMSDSYQMDASEYHHRCAQCYAGWLVRQNGQLTKGRKHYECEGCGAAIASGDSYWLGLRSAGVRLKYPERVQVCNACQTRYRLQYANNPEFVGLEE